MDWLRLQLHQQFHAAPPVGHIELEERGCKALNLSFEARVHHPAVTDRIDEYACRPPALPRPGSRQRVPKLAIQPQQMPAHRWTSARCGVADYAVQCTRATSYPCVPPTRVPTVQRAKAVSS